MIFLSLILVVGYCGTVFPTEVTQLSLQRIATPRVHSVLHCVQLPGHHTPQLNN